ncbi:hypothetical protein Dimus_024569 [Dionaea muscipula]
MDHHWYLGALEEVVIRALSSMFSIKASQYGVKTRCPEAYFSQDHEVPGGMVMVKPSNDQEFAQDRRILKVSEFSLTISVMMKIKFRDSVSWCCPVLLEVELVLFDLNNLLIVLPQVWSVLLELLYLHLS